MTRKFWITIDNDEDLETRFRIALLPYGYCIAPKTKSKLSFISHRSFGLERDAIKEARALFGNVMVFRRDKAGRYRASFTLNASDISN
jgi:hypothetical protein